MNENCNKQSLCHLVAGHVPNYLLDQHYLVCRLPQSCLCKFDANLSTQLRHPFLRHAGGTRTTTICWLQLIALTHTHATHTGTHTETCTHIVTWLALATCKRTINYICTRTCCNVMQISVAGNISATTVARLCFQRKGEGGNVFAHFKLQRNSSVTILRP